MKVGCLRTWQRFLLIVAVVGVFMSLTAFTGPSFTGPPRAEASIAFDLSSPKPPSWWYQDLYMSHRDSKGRVVVDLQGRLWWYFKGKAVWENLNWFTEKYRWLEAGQGAVVWRAYRRGDGFGFPKVMKKIQITERVRTKGTSVSISIPASVGFTKVGEGATLELADEYTHGLFWNNWRSNTIELTGYTSRSVWKDLSGVAYFKLPNGSTMTHKFGLPEEHRCVKFSLTGHYRCPGKKGTGELFRLTLASGARMAGPGVAVPYAIPGGSGSTSGPSSPTRCAGSKATLTAAAKGGKLSGTPRRDVIVGGAGKDEIDGRGGNDVICGRGGNDRLLGGGGNDSLAGEGGSDTLIGGSGRDSANGGSGKDKVVGSDGADKLFGGAGADRVNSGGGADLASGGSGADAVAGGAGADVVSGGSAADAVVGDEGDDQVSGGVGADKVDGGAGGDSLGGGAGNDSIADAAGTNVVNAGAGSDTVTTGAGNDVVSPDSGAAPTADADDASPAGGTAADGSGTTSLLETKVEFPGSSPSDTTVDYCFDCETVPKKVEAADDVVDTGDGNDTVAGSPGNDTVKSGAGSDSVTGGSGNDVIDGGAGRDDLGGSTGSDQIEGGGSRDTINGGGGSDTVSGGGGGDLVKGGPEDASDGGDTVSGGDSVDELVGGAGNDTITGDAGADTTYGGGGSDSLDGGAGYDSSYGEGDGASTCSNNEEAFQCSSTGGSFDASLPTVVNSPLDGVGCTAYADPNGDDGDPGTKAQPFRTAEHLINSLRAGQVGCLTGGVFTEPDHEINVRTVGAPGESVVLRTEPGSPFATVVGRFYVRAESHDVVIRNVILDGRNPLAVLRGAGAALPSPTVDGDRITVTEVDASSLNSATCFVVGSVLGYGIATDVRITRSRIHDCGERHSPLKNSGDHAINLEGARNAVVADNVIYNNVDRGILVYPDAQNSDIEFNVIDGNGRAISFGGEVVPASGWDPAYTPGDRVYPDETTVKGNVISNSTLNYASFEHWQVEGFHPWGGPPVPSANVVTENCLFHADPSKNLQSPPIDFTPSSNTVATSGAGFADRAQGNFSLTGAAGTCPTSFGPRP